MGISPITVPPALATVLTAAGDKSGVDFGYLLQTAMRESALNPNAKAQTSSAVGLFQFLESTWLEVMKSDGGRLGYQHYADAIVERGGEYTIPNKALRAEVLKLREDPQIAADLAAAFTKNNGEYLEQRFGRMPSPGELYIAHFLGAKGAAKMFEAGLANPDQIAAKLFPKQAQANRAIFYDDGKARTIREVYQALVAKHRVPNDAPPVDAGFATQQIAATQSPLPLPAPLQVPPELGGPPAAVVPASTTETAPPVMGGPQPKWTGEAIPSRFGPMDASFFTSIATGAEPAKPRTLISPAPDKGPGLFGH
jgi:hypothetical protein